MGTSGTGTSGSEFLSRRNSDRGPPRKSSNCELETSLNKVVSEASLSSFARAACVATNVSCAASTAEREVLSSIIQSSLLSSASARPFMAASTAAILASLPWPAAKSPCVWMALCSSMSRCSRVTASKVPRAPEDLASAIFAEVRSDTSKLKPFNRSTKAAILDGSGSASLRIANVSSCSRSFACRLVAFSCASSPITTSNRFFSNSAALAAVVSSSVFKRSLCLSFSAIRAAYSDCCCAIASTSLARSTSVTATLPSHSCKLLKSRSSIPDSSFSTMARTVSWKQCRWFFGTPSVCGKEVWIISSTSLSTVDLSRSTLTIGSQG
mmetsp:Transcript_19733/g.52737  ORF Transcript_19733/g.52737 Transcript_19733/m.52737 type:complete len:325 (+) Transcript_19733:336-1310(+)